MLQDFLQHVHPIAVRHDLVEQHDGGTQPAEPVHSLGCAVRCFNSQTAVLQRMGDQLQVPGVIVNCQKRRFFLCRHLLAYRMRVLS